MIYLLLFLWFWVNVGVVMWNSLTSFEKRLSFNQAVVLNIVMPLLIIIKIKSYLVMKLKGKSTMMNNTNKFKIMKSISGVSDRCAIGIINILDMLRGDYSK